MQIIINSPVCEVENLSPRLCIREKRQPVCVDKDPPYPNRHIIYSAGLYRIGKKYFNTFDAFSKGDKREIEVNTVTETMRTSHDKSL